MPQQGGAAEQDGMMGTMGGIIVLTSILCVALWYGLNYQLKVTVLHFMQAQAEVMLVVLKPILTENTQISLSKFYEYVYLTDPNEMTLSDITMVISAGGSYIKYPVALIFIIYGVYTIRSPAVIIYRRKFDVWSFLEEQARVFPRLKPIIPHAKKLLHDPKYDTGEFGYSIPLIDWCLNYNLLGKMTVVGGQDKVVELHKDDLDIKGYPETSVVLLRDKAAQRMIKQLGIKNTLYHHSYEKQYQRFKKLSLYQRILIATFSANVAQNYDQAGLILDEAAGSFYDSKDPINRKKRSNLFNKRFIQFSQKTEQLADSTFKKYQRNPEFQKIIASHYYQTTMMYALFSKTVGLASADFIWLRVMDRGLFFLLNAVGRNGTWSETLAVRAHYDAEIVNKAPLEKPFLHVAILQAEKMLKMEAWSEYDKPAFFYETVEHFEASDEAIEAILSTKLRYSYNVETLLKKAKSDNNEFISKPEDRE